MEADIILQTLEPHLRPLIEAAGGKLEVCGTPEDTLELLKVNPVNFLILMQWGGNDNLGAGNSINDEEFQFVVHTSAGFKLQRGKDVYVEGTNGRLNFIRLCAMLRKWVRSIRFVTPDDAPECHPEVDCHDGFLPSGSKWLAGGLEELSPVRTMILSFRLKIAMDYTDSTPLALPVTT